MRTLNEDAIEYAANNLYTTELGYTEIIWGPEIAPEGSRMQEREFNEVVLRGRQRHSLRRMRLVKTPSAAIGMIVANTTQGGNVHTKNEFLCHHKTVIRSTEPPISRRCCYGLVIL